MHALLDAGHPRICIMRMVIRMGVLLDMALSYLQRRAQNSNWVVKCYCSTSKLLQPMLQSIIHFRFCFLGDSKMESDQNILVVGWGSALMG
jgi:hypothetical protein